ncbi:MAG: XRE family transcriptional regulator [Dehalococcoidia bacterium]|nr:XRE family transcriptional regulator [Dehalococcoidia bacterium]
MSTITTDAYITPEIIEWARKRRNYSIHTLADRIQINPQKIEAWEKGDARPSFDEAQILAKKLYIPFGYLYLSKPPAESFPLPDLRTITKRDHIRPSPDFLDVLYDALRKQDWYRQNQESNGAESISFIGKFTLNDSPEIIAQDIRNTLEIDDNMRQRAANWELFLTDLIRQSETKGILVIRQGIVGNNNYRKLSVDEFRGFAISDKMAPLVFINDQDVKVAKIFTLAHELAHLWIDKSGISNLDYFRKSSEQKNAIDQFCDKVAAEVLTPASDFKSIWGFQPSIEENIDYMVRRYRVSRFVVLRRAYDLRLITYDDYLNYYQRFLEDKIIPKSTEMGFTTLLLNRNSRLFTSTLLSSTTEGRVSYLKAARLLNIKVKALQNIRDRLL